MKDETTWKEPSDFYFDLIDDEKICDAVLKEFDLDTETGHIINGHVPVLFNKGESPVKASGQWLDFFEGKVSFTANIFFEEWFL